MNVRTLYLTIRGIDRTALERYNRQFKLELMLGGLILLCGLGVSVMPYFPTHWLWNANPDIVFLTVGQFTTIFGIFIMFMAVFMFYTVIKFRDLSTYKPKP